MLDPVAKISSSPPRPGGPSGPRRPRSGEAPQKAGKAVKTSSKTSRTSEADKADKGQHDPSSDSEAQPMTMGEAFAREAELREDMHGLRRESSPYEDVHSQREDKERNEEAFEHSQRADESQKRAQKTGQKHGSSDQHQNARGVTRQPGSQVGAQVKPGGAGASGAEGRQDGFETSPMAATDKARPALEPLPVGGKSAPPMQPARMASGAMHVLNSAQEAGVYFREEGHHGAEGGQGEDAELAAAVEECIRLLFGVKGVHRIGPGVNDAGDAVIVISVSRGFGEASLRVVPPRVHRFDTLVAVPYDLLPLRRDAV